MRCLGCAAEHWRNPKPCANAVVVRDGQVLLARRARAPWLGTWHSPGGFLDAGEHPIAAAEREVFEEVGLRVRVTAYLGTWVDAYADGPIDAASEIINVAYYIAEPLGDTTPVADPSEVSDVGWFALDDLPSPGGPPGTFQAVMDAVRAVLAGDHAVHDRPT